MMRAIVTNFRARTVSVTVATVVLVTVMTVMRAPA